MGSFWLSSHGPRCRKAESTDCHLYITAIPAMLFLFLLLIVADITDGSTVCKQKETSTSYCGIVHPRIVVENALQHQRATDNAERTPTSKSAWPASLQFAFDTEEDAFHLSLTLNEKLVPSSFVIERRKSSNVSLSDVRKAHPDHGRCSYHGYALGRSKSHVAVNVCKGLFGLISIDGEDYFIEPVNASKRAYSESIPHIFYKPRLPPKRRGERSTEESHTFCATKDTRQSFPSRKEFRGRGRRSVSREWTVEAMVVVDHTMTEYYRDQHIETYVLTIMNMVASHYHEPSIGNSIDVVLVRLILLEEEQDDLEITNHADHTLDSFCKWQQKYNPKGDDDPLHYDNAILLTRTDLCKGINEPCNTLGLAHVRGMCHSEHSCSVNEDNGLSLGYTVAHEMGHNFGMHHDGADNLCFPFDETNPHIMSSRVLGGITPVTWSDCSREYITQFLDRGWGTCLEDLPSSPFTYPSLLPGVMYTANHQCRLQYGPNATVCPMFESDLCTTLWCSVGVMCQSRVSAAAPGTRCGKDKWCISGECVEIDEHPQIVIHGGWGSWSEWSECSLTCGTGVVFRERECDNPRPSPGGKYCVGKRKKYALCRLVECPQGLPSIRAMQCRSYDVVGTSFPYVPVYIEARPCELFCKKHGLVAENLAPRVLDGTPCYRSSRDICIDGFCQKVGCDNQVNSPAVEDRCGVCHGDGSTCQTIKNSFTIRSGRGYVEAIVIPAGARNIVVEEIAAAGNYIAIRDTAGRYYLNGDWIIEWSGEYEAVGTTISYQRVGDKERVEAQGPITEPLHIMLLFRAQNPGVAYEYTVPKLANETTESPVQHFSWAFGDWSPCSASCGVGSQRSNVVCMERVAGMVDDMYCEDQKADDIQRTCNVHQCPAIWWVGPWQHCSVSCGTEGTRQRSVFCIRGMMNGEHGVLHDSDCMQEGQEKPATKSACEDLPRCELATGIWFAGDWSECSASCGEGFSTRQVICFGSNGSVCSEAEQPGEWRLCFHVECELYASSQSHGVLQSANSSISASLDASESEGDLSSSFFPSNFGEWEKKEAARKQSGSSEAESLREPDGQLNCSVSCGDGGQQRSVMCIDARSGQVTSGCLERTKPVGVQPCHMGHCPKTCRDDLSSTVCHLVVVMGSCREAHFRDRCCTACAPYR
ncbi:A disintegrin and metalloproteinase with thrombospondin motifs 7-like [Diadema antillarum]|uniref:A disintegrin and metalloproteinase with thrombospondin motifs 7-like n=1 Tax=Diadema antillarum TaxID=105358 RepID=UPI003A849419